MFHKTIQTLDIFFNLGWDLISQQKKRLKLLLIFHFH